MATKKKVTKKKVEKKPAAKKVLTSTTVTPEQLAVREVGSTTSRLLAETKLFTVASQESSLQASRMLVEVKTARQQLDAKRKAITGPMREAIKRTEAMFKPFADSLDEADQTLRRKLLEYQQRVEAERRVKEEALLKEAVAAQQEGDGETAFALAVQATELEAASRTQHLDSGGTVQTKKVWTFKVEDLGAVPREYFTLDTAKVRAAIRAGVREVPGLHIYQEEQLAVSTSTVPSVDSVVEGF